MTNAPFVYLKWPSLSETPEKILTADSGNKATKYFGPNLWSNDIVVNVLD